MRERPLSRHSTTATTSSRIARKLPGKLQSHLPRGSSSGEGGTPPYRKEPDLSTKYTTANMASTERALPTRTATNMTDDDAIPDEDTSEVTKLFHERLQAWKHACGYLEDYVSATEKMQHAHAKEYEKVLKVGSHVFPDLIQDTVLTTSGRLSRTPSRKVTTSTRTWAA
jgi:hypothetical protein